MNIPLRLLVDDEIFRLTVWANPTSDPKRGQDYYPAVEKSLNDVRTDRSAKSYYCIDKRFRQHGLELFGKHGK